MPLPLGWGAGERNYIQTIILRLDYNRQKSANKHTVEGGLFLSLTLLVHFNPSKKRRFTSTRVTHTNPSSFQAAAPAAAVAGPRQDTWLTVPPTSWQGYLPQNEHTRPEAFLDPCFDFIALLRCKLCAIAANPAWKSKEIRSTPSTPEATALPPSAPAEFCGQISTLISGAFCKWGHLISSVFL